MARGEVDHRIDLRFAVAFALLAAATLGGAAAWMWSVRERLPDPLARHWTGGQADGFSELPSVLAMWVGLPLVVAVPMALVAIVGRSPVALRRAMGATSVFLLVCMAVLFADSVRMQLDLPDAAAAPAPDVGLAVGLLIGGAAAAAALLVIRPRPEESDARVAGERPPPAAPRLGALPELPWRAAPSGLDTAAALTCGVAAVLLVALVPLAGWPMLLLVVPLLVLGGAFGRYRVVIDERGLAARAFGRDVLRVPLAEVAEADSVEVDPFWEFGGWGLRVDVAGRVGLVTRKGPSVRIRRADDSEVVVTVDDAATAAALLNTLADRSRPADGHAAG